MARDDTGMKLMREGKCTKGRTGVEMKAAMFKCLQAMQRLIFHLELATGRYFTAFTLKSSFALHFPTFLF